MSSAPTTTPPPRAAAARARLGPRPRARPRRVTLALVVAGVVTRSAGPDRLRVTASARGPRPSARRWARQVASVWRGGRPSNARSSALAGPAASPRASATRGRLALLAREQVEDRAAEQHRVGAGGREAGGRALAQAAGDRRARVARPGRRSTARRPRAATPSAAREHARAELGAAARGWPPATIRRASSAAGRASASPASPRRSTRAWPARRGASTWSSCSPAQPTT